MKQYIINFFKYNDWANRQLLQAIHQLPDKTEAINLFSHFITSQDKWMNRITKQVEDAALTWFGPVFLLDELEAKWKESVDKWIIFSEKRSEEDLNAEIVFTRATDGKRLSVKLTDIMLQLNYHSIHHRAQISRIIREQGFTPPATDYIFTVLKEVL